MMKHIPQRAIQLRIPGKPARAVPKDRGTPLRRAAAAILALGLLIGGTTAAMNPASGAGGSGGAGGGTGNVDASGYGVHYYFFDDRQDGVPDVQGTGQSSMDYFLSQLAPGGDSGFDFAFINGTLPMADRMQASCDLALERATQRAIDNGEGALESRVVGMLWAFPRGFAEGDSATINPSYFNEALDYWPTQSYEGFFGKSLGTLTDGMPVPAYVVELGKAAVAETAALSGTVSTVCIALNSAEPPNPWIPEPEKQVVGSGEESGGHTYENINGMSVLPGQKLEYTMKVDLNVPTGLIVSQASVKDTYDPNFIPDKGSVELFDNRTGLPVPASAYGLSWDDPTHTFTGEFTPAWIAANMIPGGVGWVTVRFSGTVNPDLTEATVVKNQAWQIVDNEATPTVVPEVNVPPIEPDKEDLNEDLEDIDGKTVAGQEKIIYRVTMDGGTPAAENAYYVHRLGIVDDYDDAYLDVTAADVTVLEKTTGTDVTASFNIAVVDGVVYAFAKQVDSVSSYGETLLGEPQPTDLAAYETAEIVENVTPIIDQSLLGQDYWVMIRATVIKETDGYVIENHARQIFEHLTRYTRVVSNPLKQINPDKDAVVSPATGDTSIHNTEVALDSVFNYRLNTSLIPAGRANQASTWVFTDTFDRAHDCYTGLWAVHANTDLYDGDTLAYAKGALIADSTGVGADMFTAAWDDASYAITVTAGQAYLDLVNSRGDLEQGWSVYVQMQRIAPAEEVLNFGVETYNGAERVTNVVRTFTPDPYGDMRIQTGGVTALPTPSHGWLPTAVILLLTGASIAVAAGIRRTSIG